MDKYEIIAKKLKTILGILSTIEKEALRQKTF